MMAPNEILVDIKHLHKLYPVGGGIFTRTDVFVHAVSDLNLQILRGESVGLVGESGCGKTTTGKLLTRLIDPTEGHIYVADTLKLPSLGSGIQQVKVAELFISDEKTGDEPLPEGEAKEIKEVLVGQPILTVKTASGAVKKIRSSFTGAVGEIVVKPGDAVKVGDTLMLGWADLARLRRRNLKAFRRRVQMIFQDPYESMNPRMTIYDTVAEPLDVQGIGSVAEREERVANLLETVGLTPASSFMFRYPHELSGGQRQRVAIARALVVEPSFVVADEPTSMLDVSVRTGVMNLMQDLADRLGVTYLYITHDLAVARYMCHRIAVMYLGKLVEMAETEELLHNPLHPYTKALLSAVPVPDPTYTRESVQIEGGITRPINPPPRCRFYDRCPRADDYCQENDHPPLDDKGGEHFVACYHV